MLLKIRSELEVIGRFGGVPLLRWRECCSRHRGVSGRVCAWRRVSHDLRGLHVSNVQGQEVDAEGA